MSASNLRHAAHRAALRARSGQRGATLVEALIAILIFALGLLGTLKMQSYSAEISRDAMYRAEASVLAHEMIGIIWTDRTNLAAYLHGKQNPNQTCDDDNTVATSPNALNWLAEFTTAGTRYLPGAAANKQQIIVVNTVPPIVRVHICWRGPQDTEDRSFVAVSQLP
jgi:type IV pilus assembly protein PilV